MGKTIKTVKEESCSNCKFLKADKTCKFSHGEKNGDDDWCSGHRPKK